MKKYSVYVHTCPNGKRYVGCTTQARPELRWGRNGEGYQHQLFGRAILKYGWENITHEVFEVDSKEEMYRKEVELISFYHSNDPEYGYNNSVGGEKSALGYRHSEEARKKISEATKKSNLDPEVRRKRSEALKGRTFSEEHRKHMSEVRKGKPGKPCSEEQRKKISEAMKGRTLSEEHRRKDSEARKREWSDPEIRRKKCEAMKGKLRPRVKIQLPDGTVIEITKQLLTRDYINKGKKFEYLP